MKTIFILSCVFFFFSCHEKEWTVVQTSDGSALQPRHECGFVEVNDQFYLLGGRGNKQIDIYDPKNNTWTKGAMPPLEIHHFQPVVFRDVIVVLGAMSGPYPQERPISNILYYQPQNNQWIIGDTIPSTRARGSGGTIVYNDIIYWVGGISQGHIGGHKSFFDAYDPIQKKWEALPDAPRARDHFQAVLYKDKLYITGGRRTKAPYGVTDLTLEEIDVYDFNTGEWTTLETTLPTPRAGTMSTLYNNVLVFAGGEEDGYRYSSNAVEGLNLDKMEWVMLPNLVKGTHSTGIIAYKNKLWIASGSYKTNAGLELPDLYVY